jgi:hypothetical protein
MDSSYALRHSLSKWDIIAQKSMRHQPEFFAPDIYPIGNKFRHQFIIVVLEAVHAGDHEARWGKLLQGGVRGAETRREVSKTRA